MGGFFVRAFLLLCTSSNEFCFELVPRIDYSSVDCFKCVNE